MTTCRGCGQTASTRLCKECEFDRDREFYQNRAEEMENERRNSHTTATLQLLRKAEEEGIDGASERIEELSGGDA